MHTVRFPSARALALAAIAVVASLAETARANWPMARHDPGRTGTAVGTSNITSPVSYWRTYLGGTTGAGEFLTTDADGDGKPDLILVSGGRILAKRTDDSVIWSSDLRGLDHFGGMGDLDGDGVVDLVAVSGSQVIVFAANTGAVEWTEPAGEMGTLGAARVADVTGDGKPDVVVSECGCCGVYSGNNGFIWSFGSGFSSASRLGALPVYSCASYNSLTLVQADASSKYEILVADYTHFALTDSTGTVLASTGNVGTWASLSDCVAANVDGIPGDEAICILNSSLSPSTNERRITVLHYNYGDGGLPGEAGGATLDVLWNKTVAPDTGGDMQFVDPVVDLDGDGKYEIVVSTLDPSTGWQTRIFDAASGTEFTPAIGSSQVVAGTAALEQTSQRLLLTTSSSGGLTAWKFSRSASPTISQRWQLANVQPITYARPELLALGSVDLALLTAPLQTSLDDLVVLSQAGSSTLEAYSAAAGSTSQIGSLNLASGTGVQYAWTVSGITTSTNQIALARTDGVMNLLDDSIQPAHLSAGSGGASGPEIDVHFGGYYATGGWRETSNAPRVLSLDGSKNEAILVPNSRKSLQRFNASSASWASPPTPAWSLDNTYAPVIVPNLDGTNPAAVCLSQQSTNPPKYTVRAVKADGSLKWDVALETAPLADLVPGNFNGDSTPDVALQWAAPNGSTLETKALSGVDGHTLWETSPFSPGAGGLQSPGISVGNFNSDQYDDIYFQGLATLVLSGSDGSQIGTSAASTASYALPLLPGGTDGGASEVLLTAFGGPVTALTSDLSSTLWTSTDTDGDYPYGGVASCSGTSPSRVLVEGSWQHPSRIKVTQLTGSTAGTFSTYVLAGGNVYSTEAAATAGAGFLGQLTSANVHSNLTGQSHPTAVVGSTDGWLYGFNPCGGTLDFTIQIGSAVGEAVFGDTDGDGHDEILVTAADGYLYDIRNYTIAKPSYVWDIDPPAGITDHDVDTIVTYNTLYGKWAAVSGATGYTVAVTSSDGTIISSPAWQDAGTSTQASVTGLSLSVGSKYIFAVRSLSAAGASVDAVSNGVIVTAIDGGTPEGGEAGADSGAAEAGGEAGADAAMDATLDAADGSLNPPSGGAGGGGCGCRVASRDGTNEGALAAFGMSIGLLLARRRKGWRR